MLSSSFWPLLNSITTSATRWAYYAFLPCHQPHTNHLLFEKGAPFNYCLFFFKHTSFLLFPPLLWAELLRCLFSPQLKWDCIPKFHEWPSNQPLRAFFSVPILLDFLKCQKAMTNSSWKLSRSLALKTVLSWSSFCYSNYFFCLSWSIFHFLLQKHGILLGLSS